jgi:thiamine-phosphate pyrophosphorylase
MSQAEATASPRLLLVSPPLDDTAASQALAAALPKILDAPVAVLLLRGGGLDDATLGPRIAPLIALAQARDVAVLLEDRPELLEASGADGLHLNLTEDRSPLKDLRRRFGDAVILGAGCGTSRHLAMTAGEQGADYVGFGELDGAAADPELVAWWEAMMTPPQVAFGAASPEDARALAAAGPDFLAIGPGLWLAAANPAAALKELLATSG